ncbi:MAG: tryptophan-rich sensory protein [Cyclobacteriaceae bacterium]|jgi:benzodiazapine receptor|nr:tryptophan-rich sensory protein [Cyclobacteriaceae bacterium]
MKKPYMLALVSTLLFAITILVNALANILPINGLNTGEVSALYPSLFTPAGLTFSIWSVIYLLLLGFIVWHWLKPDSFAILEISRLFWLTCILNVSWILAWHYLLTAISVTIMLLLLLTLTQLYLKIKKVALLSLAEKWLVKLPFTLYFAWISVATIANVSAYLVSVNWDGGFFTPLIWTILMMGIAVVLAAWISMRFREPGFALVVVWALFGIFWRHQEDGNASLTMVSLGYMLILVAWVVLVLIKIMNNKKVTV